MATQTPTSAWKGSGIRSHWSLDLIVARVLYTLQTPNAVFHGVLAHNQDRWLVDGPDESLLWVCERDGSVAVWQEDQQRPTISEGRSDHDMGAVIGHYDSRSGALYYSIKWVGYECPTWESEQDLDQYAAFLDQYWTSFPHQNLVN
ncbi:hypothetical protein PG991_009317 [Apiospora marii]|uniref:Chromo domain-containing protein n=1 Tax=Apiospora marii TaxID=335849 RepID=A0ABR1RKC9_9PEZI